MTNQCESQQQCVMKYENWDKKQEIEMIPTSV